LIILLLFTVYAVIEKKRHVHNKETLIMDANEDTEFG
jgi:hypothetical protein